MKHFLKETLVVLICATFIFGCKKKKDAAPEKPCQLTSLKISYNFADGGGSRRFSSESLLGVLGKKKSAFESGVDFYYDEKNRVSSYTTFRSGEVTKKYKVNYNEAGEITSLVSKRMGNKLELIDEIKLTKSDTRLDIVTTSEQEYLSGSGEVQKRKSTRFGAFDLDAQGRLNTIYDVSEIDGKKQYNKQFSVEYQEDGNVKKLSFPNGSSTSLENYDTNNKSIVFSNPSLLRIFLVDPELQNYAPFVLGPNGFQKLSTPDGGVLNATYEVNEKGYFTKLITKEETRDGSGPDASPMFEFKIKCD